MPELPSGTVTFLFTDIERSTESAAVLGDERWADALQTHRDLLRPAFDAHQGVEVGTEGDAFFVAFARAQDAVNAATEGQRALESHQWPGEFRVRVRMGMHTGEALVRANDYVGHDVHKAKRICDAGHGGQILLSQTTADLVGTRGLLTDLGPHRLKDLGEPQRLYQLAADGLPSGFPALRSLEAFRHNLPAQRSTFVGREKEIGFLRDLLGEHRLVTLTGVGGCGKTRLALQVGAEVLDDYADGVFFVDFAPISDAGLVLQTVAGAIGSPTGDSGLGVPGAPVDRLLLDFLTQRSCLILLDNCEHLLDVTADLADRVLTECPNVSIVATSREGLEIEGERSFRVPSLSLPDDADGAPASEAVSLFKTRAAEVRPGFELTPENIDAVVAICRRLDGIPLAVEFAASRVSHLTPREIDERLSASFRLLAGGRRRVQRQQTIEATLDWSYDLLHEAERFLLRRLAVFSGSFSLEAAEGICSDETVGPDGILDLVASLVAKSLVTADEGPAGSRYRLLETVRLYAAEKLKAADEAEVTHDRHRDWYLQRLESYSWDEIFSSGTLMTSLDAEHANLFAAVAWSSSQNRPDLVAKVAGRMYLAWAGHYEQGYRILSELNVEELDITPDERIACLLGAAQCSSFGLHRTGATFSDRAIAVGEGTDTLPFAIALYTRTLTRSVEAAFTRDRDAAARVRADFDRADAILAANARAWAIGRYVRAFAETTMQDFAAAAAPLDDALQHLDPKEDWFSLAAARSLAATLAHARGDHASAATHARKLIGSGIVGWGTWKSGVVGAEATAIAGAGDIAEAKELLASWFDDVLRSGMPGSLEELVVGIAAVVSMDGDHALAARLLAWVRSRTLDRIVPIRSPIMFPVYLHHVRRVRDALGHDAAARALAEGRAMTEDEAVERAREAIHAP